MTITNRNNLPDILVQVAQAYSDDYIRTIDKNRYSASELLSPPHMVHLQRLYWDKLESDVSEMLFAIRGQAIHMMMEQVGKMFPDRYKVEEKLELPIKIRDNEYIVSLRYDCYDKDKEVLHDHKSTSVWSAIYEPTGKPEWKLQTRIYAYAIEKLQGLKVKSIEIIALLYDWSKLEAKKQANRGYPQEGTQIIHINSLEETGFTNDKIENKIIQLLENHLGYQGQICTPEERWKTEDLWKLMPKDKPDGKSYKNCKSEAEAREAIGTMSTGYKYHIVFVPGEDKRCLNYCSTKNFCEYYKQMYGVKNDNLQDSIQ